jgi:hypothetical protein
MEFDYKHSLDADSALERLKALGDYLSNRHGLHSTWNGNRATIVGRYKIVKIEGELSMSDGVVHFKGKDPGRLLRKKAINYLQGKLGKYLDPNTPVDSLPRG